MADDRTSAQMLAVLKGIAETLKKIESNTSGLESRLEEIAALLTERR